VRELYQKLRAEAWIQPWLDEEELYPGQDWNMEIEKAIQKTDVIIVCLSKSSITKEGYVQKEIKTGLDYSDYKPEGALFIIPVRLESCDPPSRLSKWQYADYFEGQRERAFQRLLVSLKRRADSIGLKLDSENVLIVNGKRYVRLTEAPKPTQSITPPDKITLSNGMEFVRVPAGKFLMGSDNDFENEKPQHTVDIPYDYWMAHYPVTNELYNAYVKAKRIGHPVFDWQRQKTHPIVSVSCKDAMAYCQWLNQILNSEFAQSVQNLQLRLPTEAEWEKAARGTDGRKYPWGNQFDKNKCNTSEGGKGGTTPVGLYSPQGDSPYGCADMSGNVWEWTHSLYKLYPYQANDGRENEKASGARVLRGGSFINLVRNARCVCRYGDDFLDSNRGFRVVVSPVTF
jgi:formylglycine-generating enzyme required for sulfatase activity